MRINRIAVSLFAAMVLAPCAFGQAPLRNLPPEGFKYLSSKDVEGLMLIRQLEERGVTVREV